MQNILLLFLAVATVTIGIFTLEYAQKKPEITQLTLGAAKCYGYRLGYAKASGTTDDRLADFYSLTDRMMLEFGTHPEIPEISSLRESRQLGEEDFANLVATGGELDSTNITFVSYKEKCYDTNTKLRSILNSPDRIYGQPGEPRRQLVVPQ